MFKIVFVVATLSGIGEIEDKVTTFKDLAECAAYGEATSSRIEDWVRGRLGVDFRAPVKATFRCDANGNPA